MPAGEKRTPKLVFSCGYRASDLPADYLSTTVLASTGTNACQQMHGRDRQAVGHHSLAALVVQQGAGLVEQALLVDVGQAVSPGGDQVIRVGARVGGRKLGVDRFGGPRRHHPGGGREGWAAAGLSCISGKVVWWRRPG